MWTKILKIGLLVLGLLVVLVLVVGLFVPKTFVFERSVSIAAPADSVWKYTGSLSGLDKWSPWNDYDPDVKKTMTGVDGAIGACQTWESDKIGTGSQTILRIDTSELLVTKLDFLKPHESHGQAFVKLESESGATKVTWGMSGSMPYPFNIMILFMNMEKMMGKDFDNGLNKLKRLVEK